MAIKDYKSHTHTTQPPKKSRNKDAFKKAAIVLGVGFILGSLTTGGLCLIYLGGDENATRDASTERTAAEGAEGAGQTEKSATTEAASHTQPEEQSIDYLFYEALANFQLPPPAPNTRYLERSDKHLPLRQEDTISQVESRPKDGKSTSQPRYILQAGTFTDAQRAQTQRRKIIDLGYKEVHVSRIAHNNQLYHRVWLGFYTNLENAKVIRNALRAAQIEVMLRHNLKGFGSSAKVPESPPR